MLISFRVNHHLRGLCFLALFSFTTLPLFAQSAEPSSAFPAGCPKLEPSNQQPPQNKGQQITGANAVKDAKAVNATPVNPLENLCQEWADYQSQLEAVSLSQTNFTRQKSQLGELTDAAKEIADNYEKDLNSRKDSLQAIQKTLLGMIQLTRLQPLLDGKALQECAVRLVQSQNDLVKKEAALRSGALLSAKDVTQPQSQPQPQTPKENTPQQKTPNQGSLDIPQSLVAFAPAQSTKLTAMITVPPPISETGLRLPAEIFEPRSDLHNLPSVLPPAGPPSSMQGNGNPAPAQEAAKYSDVTGRILAFDDGVGLTSAVVVLQCGTNGSTKYVSSTNAWGQYYFSSVPHTFTPCILRGARNLTEQRALDIQAQIRKSGLGSLTAQDWSYEEKSINPVNLDNYLVVAPDLRLSHRKSRNGEFARVLTGFEQSGASASDSAQKYFFDFYLSIPVTLWPSTNWQGNSFGPRFRIWGDARITSVPQQVTSSLGEFAIGFSEQIANVKVNQIAQAAQFEIGGEERITSWGWARNPFFSFDHSSAQRFGLYGIASFGRTSTLNPRNTVEIFNNPQPGTEPNFDQQIAALGLTSQLAGKKYVAFASDDRLKFYKDYYAGIRLKTFYYDPDTAEALGRFPATLDAVFGQNETVTGGRLRGVVGRIDGFYPFPFDSLKFIYLFGTADILVGGRKAQNTIFLQQATNTPALPDPSILLVSTPQLARDHYRLAVGIDVLQLFSTIKSSSDNKPKQPQPPKTNPVPGAGAAPPPANQLAAP